MRETVEKLTVLSNACPKLKTGKTRRDERAEKRAAIEAHWREVCRDVDRRDGVECRVCGARCATDALDLLLRAERHHLIPSSRGGPDETWNICRVCKRCHDERHVKGTLQLSGNADERNEMGKLAGICCERLTEAGWVIEKWC